MAAFDPATLDRWRALAIVDRDGTTVGTISEFYLDRETGYPTWALVNTGLFGATQTFVPLVHATEISDGLQVPYEKRHIKDTPKIDTRDELSPQEEAELFAHYGVDYRPVAEPGSGEGPAAGSVEAGSGDAGVADSSTVAGDEGPGPIRADRETDGSPTVVPGPGLAAVDTEGGTSDPSGGQRTVAGSGDRSVEGGTAAKSGERPVADGMPDTGQTPGAVPGEPGSVDAPETVSTQVNTVTAGATEAAPAGSSSGDATTGRHDSSADAVPAEPGTTQPDEATRVDPQGSGSDARGSDGFGSSVGQPEGQTGHDPSQTTPLHTDHNPSVSTPLSPGPARPETAPPGIGPAAERTQAAGHDPDLARTAPVEPGLPGSTAASPYGPGSATIDKAAHPPATSAEEPPRAPDEAGWAPGAAGSFEEQQPFDRPRGASDHWREAKLAAERDRIARTAAAQHEERSPLERARRRLERLVGVGQDDSDEISPADRDAAERARRARLGLDEDDRRR
jgi:PRC-barrel domain